MSTVATGLHFLPTRALGHDWWLRCKHTCKRDFLEDCFQGADLAERWVSSLPYLLPNCSLDFSCDGWNSCSCIEQSCKVGDVYHPRSGWPTSIFVSVGEKNQVYLAKVMVVYYFAMCIQTNHDTTMCLTWYSLIILLGLVNIFIFYISLMFYLINWFTNHRYT